MPPSAPSSLDASEIFDRALAEYEAALEGGDSVAAADVLQRFPDHAADLIEYRNDRQALETLARPLRQAVLAQNELPSIAGYEVLELLDGGGMGVVYRARYERLSQIVALKVMRSDRFASPQELQRFRTEAESASTVDHPGIVGVYDIGQWGGRPYYSMELVQGESLKERLLRTGTHRPREAAHLMFNIAEAMAAAHRQGVVHRDLKPGNVLIDRYGHPRIIDFGLAKIIGNESDVTRPGDFLGTVLYTSPEQAEGKGNEAQSPADVYSLGVILYELLTGQPPLVGANELQTIEKVRHQEPLPPRFHEPNTPRDLEAICLKCLEKNPQDRYPDAGALAEDLKRFLDQRPVLARPDWWRAFGWMNREVFEDPITKVGPRMWAFMGIYTVCLLLVQGLMLLQWGEPLAWLLLFAGTLPIFVTLRTDDSPTMLPSNPAERMLWAIWLAVAMGKFLLCLGMRMAHQDFALAFHEAFCVLPFLTGVGYFVMGGYWTKNCLWGVGYMLFGVVQLAFVPVPWAPLFYAIFTAFSSASLALKQHRLSRQKTRIEGQSTLGIAATEAETY